MRKSKAVKKVKVSKPVASTRRLKKFDNGGGTNKLKEFTNPGLEGYPGPEYGETEPKIYLKPKTALEAAKDLKINPPKATAQTLEQQTASSQDLMKGLMRPPKKEVAVTPTKVSTPKSVATKSPKTVSDSYKKSLQGLMDKGKSIDELVKAGYGTKQGLTNLGLTAPKKATATKPTTPKKPTASDLKKEGQRLKAEGMKQKGIGMAIKGKGLRNKAIAETRYVVRGYINRTNKLERKIEEIKQGKKQTKEGDYLPDKSVLTETEKKAAAKYKASLPKYKMSPKDKKELAAAKSGESNYGNNIVGDLMSGPVKGAVAAGVGLYGLYKAGKFAKNLSNVGKAVTKSIATKSAKAGGSKVASEKIFAAKKALKVLKDLSKKRVNTQAAKNLAKNTALKPDRILKPIKKAIPRSTNAGKTIKVKGRTVSEGSQKLLGNGQKMLGNGQKMLGNTKGLPAPKKGLPSPKFRNAKPKPGDQLKLNLRRGGKK